MVNEIDDSKFQNFLHLFGQIMAPCQTWVSSVLVRLNLWGKKIALKKSICLILVPIYRVFIGYLQTRNSPKPSVLQTLDPPCLHRQMLSAGSATEVQIPWDNFLIHEYYKT